MPENKGHKESKVPKVRKGIREIPERKENKAKKAIKVIPVRLDQREIKGMPVLQG